MKIINSQTLEAHDWKSPKGKYGGSNLNLSTSLGRDMEATDIMRRHPFDVAITTLAPGQTYCPYHAHDAQWEFYHVIQGEGVVRSEDGDTQVTTGDAFLFKPGEAHQLRNDSDKPFTYYIIADNPLSDHCFYPDSNKWLVHQPEKRLLRSEPIDYFDGEE